MISSGIGHLYSPQFSQSASWSLLNCDWIWHCIIHYLTKYSSNLSTFNPQPPHLNRPSHSATKSRIASPIFCLRCLSIIFVCRSRENGTQRGGWHSWVKGRQKNGGCASKTKANKTKTKDRAAWTKVGQKSGWLAFVCLRPLSWKMTIPRLMTLLNWWRRWRALFLIFLSPLSVYTPQFRKGAHLHTNPHTHTWSQLESVGNPITTITVRPARAPAGWLNTHTLATFPLSIAHTHTHATSWLSEKWTHKKDENMDENLRKIATTLEVRFSAAASRVQLKSNSRNPNCHLRAQFAVRRERTTHTKLYLFAAARETTNKLSTFARAHFRRLSTFSPHDENSNTRRE